MAGRTRASQEVRKLSNGENAEDALDSEDFLENKMLSPYDKSMQQMVTAALNPSTLEGVSFGWQGIVEKGTFAGDIAPGTKFQFWRIDNTRLPGGFGIGTYFFEARLRQPIVTPSSWKIPAGTVGLIFRFAEAREWQFICENDPPYFVNGVDFEWVTDDAPAIAEPAKKVKVTKKALSDFMRWSSSRANEYTKAEAVLIAYEVLRGTYQPPGAKEARLEFVFNTGGFAEHGRLTSRKYLVDFATQSIVELGEADKAVDQLVFEAIASPTKQS